MNINERIDRLIDLTARVESGGRYDAWNPDDKGKGVSCGLIQFNQALGSLFELISRFAAANPQLAYQIAPQLHPLNEKWFRSVNLNAAIFKNQLLGLLREPAFQPIQRQLAREEYFDPAAKLCARFGLVSERAHAMAFDVAVQYGVGGLERMLNSAATYTPTPSNERASLGLLASYADMHEYDANRRHKLLASPELSGAPLFGAPAPTETRPTLRRGDSRREVADLRQALGLLHEAGIDSIYRFDKALAVAVADFQRAHGLAADGICGPATWKALDQAAKEGGRKG